jgi:hypothetical protein
MGAMLPRGPIDRLHTAALGVWIGALGMIGAGAPLVFVTLRTLDPSLPEYQAYGGPHYLIAGGKIVHRLFAVCDGVQIACLVTAELTFLLTRRARARGAGLVRGGILAALAGLLAYRLLVLDPAIEPRLREYWDAARAGDTALAAAARATYDAGHRIENILFGITAALVVTALALAIAQRRNPAHAAPAA